jgi:hypothetical protein
MMQTCFSNIHNPRYFQDELFEIMPRRESATLGQRRCHYGNIAEEYVCKALGLDNIKIDSNYPINFDAKDHSLFYEIKSVGVRSRKVVVYKFRLEKELPYAAKLRYVIFLHALRGQSKEAEIWDALYRSLPTIVIMSPETVHALCKDLKINKHKSEGQSGYVREGYRDGYYKMTVPDTSSTKAEFRYFERYNRTFTCQVQHL